MVSQQVILYIFAFVSLLMWIFQVIALAHPGAYVESKRPGNWCDGCGIFHCECTDWDLRKSDCGEMADHMKAACAFGVLAVLLLSVSMIVHIMLAFNKTAGMLLSSNMGSQLVNYMWVVHLISAVFNLICWAILAGAYDRQLCRDKLKDWNNLTFGFFFLVINTVGDAILAYCCWKHMHVGGGGGGGGGGRRSGPPPGYYESNPIDRQGFQRRY